MFDIYNLIKSGKTADEVADSFTKELNEALQKKKAEDEAVAAKELAATYKKGCAADIAEQLTAFVEEHYPELVNPEAETDVITGEMVINLFDALSALQEGLNSLKVSCFETPDTKRVSIKTTDDVSDVFDKFFKKYGL